MTPLPSEPPVFTRMDLANLSIAKSVMLLSDSADEVVSPLVRELTDLARRIERLLPREHKCQNRDEDDCIVRGFCECVCGATMPSMGDEWETP